MYPHTHFLFPFFLAMILEKLGIFSWQLVVICGIIGVLVDIDHYIEHIIHSKLHKFSIRGTWNNSIHYHRFSQRSFIHYWQGCLLLSVLFLLIGFINLKFAAVLFIGYYSHLFLDFVYYKKAAVVKMRIFNYYFQESHYEMVFDVVLLLLIMVTFLI